MLTQVYSRLRSARLRPDSLTARLIHAAARRYRTSGVFQCEFVRGKLLHDPLYFALLHADLLPRRGRLIDLGCGRGILLALLRTAANFYNSDDWEPHAPAPPLELALTGVDIRPAHVAVAQAALDDNAKIEIGDLSIYQPEPCEVATLFDALHYLARPEQYGLIERIAHALRPGGLLLIREADAAAGMRHFATRCSERLSAIGRGHARQRHHYRSLQDWTALLEGLGFAVAARPMANGTPFSNVLIEARKR